MLGARGEHDGVCPRDRGFGPPVEVREPAMRGAEIDAGNAGHPQFNLSCSAASAARASASRTWSVVMFRGTYQRLPSSSLSASSAAMRRRPNIVEDMGPVPLSFAHAT